jgi:hypothetical protein
MLRRRWSTLAPSVRVFSHAVGLKISPRPGPSIRSTKESPVPVMTSALLGYEIVALFLFTWTGAAMVQRDGAA